MSRRYWTGSRKLTVYVDDMAFSEANLNRVFIEAKAGAGKTHILARKLIDSKSDERIYEISSAVHHGSAVAEHASLTPPHLAEFLILLLPMKYRDNLIGDAEEEYWTWSLPRFGVRKARFIYWAQVIHAWLIFLARPLAGITGVAWIGRIVDALISKFLR